MSAYSKGWNLYIFIVALLGSIGCQQKSLRHSRIVRMMQLSPTSRAATTLAFRRSVETLSLKDFGGRSVSVSIEFHDDSVVCTASLLGSSHTEQKVLQRAVGISRFGESVATTSSSNNRPHIPCREAMIRGFYYYLLHRKVPVPTTQLDLRCRATEDEFSVLVGTIPVVFGGHSLLILKPDYSLLQVIRGR